MDRTQNDVWAAGDRYEPYVGRWSRLVAGRFLSWLAVRDGSDWLDVGCGTGALTQTILERAAPRSVKSIDPSAGFIEYAKAQVDSERAAFQVGDAQALPFATSSVDASVAGLVLNFVPDPSAAVREMARVTRPAGVVAVYVWDYADRMDLMRHFWDAAAALDPPAAMLDEGRRFPICRPGPLATLFEQQGLDAVETTAIEVPTVFRDFDDYWTPFLGGQGPAPGYAMSLDDARRIELRERIRARLPVAGDGTIFMIARAWAARARKR